MAWLGGDFEPNRWRFFRYENANLTPNWQVPISIKSIFVLYFSVEI
jgi:hypothetical protein